MGSIVLIADLLHPVDGLSVELFLNRDVRHGRCWRSAMPMLLTGGIQTTSPGRISSIRPPQRCTRPQPAVTIRCWPNGWVCHAVRAPASNVTLAAVARAGSFAWKRGSRRTVPVKCLPGARPEGWEPLLLISTSKSLRRFSENGSTRFSESLESVGDLRASTSFVGEAGDEQRERLQESRHPQWAATGSNPRPESARRRGVRAPTSPQ